MINTDKKYWIHFKPQYDSEIPMMTVYSLAALQRHDPLGETPDQDKNSSCSSLDEEFPMSSRREYKYIARHCGEFSPLLNNFQL